MNYKNTENRYGVVAIFFHWLVAAGFLAAYAAVYYRQWFTAPGTPVNWTALQLHLAIGITVGVFVLLRLIWKGMNQTPAPIPGTKLEMLAARSGHYLLYVVMIIMPLTGYLGTGVGAEYLGLPRFADTAVYSTVVEGWLGLTWQAFEAPMDVIHKRGGEYVVWVLILLHIAAALYHHFIRRDYTLKRMLRSDWQRARK